MHSRPPPHLDVAIDARRGAQIRQITIAGRPCLFDADGFGDRLIESDHEQSRRAWLRHYRGGWQEILPNPGSSREWGRRILGFHGGLSQARWMRLPARGKDRFVTASRLGLLAIRTIAVAPSDDAVTVQSQVWRARRHIALPWLQHIVLPASAHVELDLVDNRIAREVGTFLGAATVGDQSFWLVPAAIGRAALHDADRRTTIALDWTDHTWPALWIWAGRDVSGHYLGLEPASCTDESQVLARQTSRRLQGTVRLSVTERSPRRPPPD